MKIINIINAADREEVGSLKKALSRTLCNITGANYAPQGFRRADTHEVCDFVATTNHALELPENGGTNPQYRYDKGTIKGRVAYRCEKRSHRGSETEIMILIR